MKDRGEADVEFLIQQLLLFADERKDPYLINALNNRIFVGVPGDMGNGVYCHDESFNRKKITV